MPIIQLGFASDLRMRDKKIIGLGTPTADADATTKAYVDGLISALPEDGIGLYNSSTTYANEDIVYDSTGIYQSQADSNTSALTVTASWTKLANFISDAEKAQIAASPGVFDIASTYEEGDQIVRGNKILVANTDLTAGAFVSSNWDDVGTGSDDGVDYLAPTIDNESYGTTQPLNFTSGGGVDINAIIPAITTITTNVDSTGNATYLINSSNFLRISMDAANREAFWDLTIGGEYAEDTSPATTQRFSTLEVTLFGVTLPINTPILFNENRVLIQTAAFAAITIPANSAPLVVTTIGDISFDVEDAQDWDSTDPYAIDDVVNFRGGLFKRRTSAVAAAPVTVSEVPGFTAIFNSIDSGLSGPDGVVALFQFGQGNAPEFGTITEYRFTVGEGADQYVVTADPTDYIENPVGFAAGLTGTGLHQADAVNTWVLRLVNPGGTIAPGFTVVSVAGVVSPTDAVFVTAVSARPGQEPINGSQITSGVGAPNVPPNEDENWDDIATLIFGPDRWNLATNEVIRFSTVPNGTAGVLPRTSALRTDFEGIVGSIIEAERSEIDGFDAATGSFRITFQNPELVDFFPVGAYNVSTGGRFQGRAITRIVPLRETGTDPDDAATQVRFKTVGLISDSADDVVASDGTAVVPGTGSLALNNLLQIAPLVDIRLYGSVGFNATSFTTLLADNTNVKSPGTTAIVAAAALFDRSTALPRSSPVEANVNGSGFPFIALNDGSGNYSFSFPQQPIGVPLAVGNAVSFFVIPPGSGFTVGHQTVLVEDIQVTATNISFGGQEIAATIPLTEAEFNAIKATSGVESQLLPGGSGAEVLGILSTQLFLYEADAVPTRTVRTFYSYGGTTQTTGATLANDWLDSDIASDTVGVTDAQVVQLLSAPKQFDPLATYALGDQIFFNEKVYAAIVGLTPAPFNILNWEVLGTGSSGTSLTPSQEATLSNTPLPFAQTSSYVIGDHIVRTTSGKNELLIATANKAVGEAFIAANWAPASSQNFQTLVELHDVRPTQGPLSITFALGTETSFTYASPSTDFRLHPTDYDLVTVDGNTLNPVIAVASRAQNGLVTLASAIPGLTAGSHQLTFQRRSEESFLEITAVVTEIDGDIHFLGNQLSAPNIPTVDPQVTDVDWYDEGVRTKSGFRAAKTPLTNFTLTENTSETDKFNVLLTGTRRSNTFNEDADLELLLDDNFGDRIISFLNGAIGYESVDVGSTDEATTGEITLPFESTTPLTVVDIETLELHLGNTVLNLDGKTVTVEFFGGNPGIRIEGIDATNDINVPRGNLGEGTVSFVRSQVDTDTLSGHSTIQSSDSRVNLDISKEDLDITLPDVVDGDAETGMIISALNYNDDGALEVTKVAAAGTPSEINIGTFTGDTPTAGTAIATNFVYVTTSQLEAIRISPTLRDYTAIYITTDEGISATSFTPGYNSPVTVAETQASVILGDTTILNIAFTAPGSTSNNDPVIQVPAVDAGGDTIPRPTAATTGTFTIDGVAPANSAAVITTAGEISLETNGLSTTWIELGTSVITINIEY